MDVQQIVEEALQLLDDMYGYGKLVLYEICWA